MKRCPECRRDYYDETLLYCLDDGAHLLDGPSSAGLRTDEPQTAILHETAPPNEVSTRQQIHTTDAADASGISQPVVNWRSGRRLIFIAAASLLLTAGILSYKFYGSGGDARVGSVAVLPFVNITGDPEFEFVSDGLAEALINNLSRLPKMKVIARSSAFTFKGKEVDPVEAADKLGVEAIVIGRVQQRPDSIVIAVEMVNAADRTQMWGETYERKLSEMRTLQTEIARTISEKLRNRLTGEQESLLAKGETKDSRAYELYLKGMYFARRGGRANIQKDIELTEQAIAIDPNFANAYAGLSISYGNMANYGSLAEAKTFAEKQKAAVLKAIELAPDSDQVLNALGGLRSQEFKWFEAESAFKRAIEINPNGVAAYSNLATVYYCLKRHNEAVELGKRAVELDPLRASVRANHMLRLVGAGRYDEAIQEAPRALELAPENPYIYIYRGIAYAQKMAFREAIADTQEACEMDKEDVDCQIGLATIYAASGDRSRGEAMLREYAARLDEVGYITLAGYYTAVGDHQKALGLLEKALVEDVSSLQALAVDHAFDPLRSEPRFRALLRNMNLPE